MLSSLRAKGGKWVELCATGAQGCATKGNLYEKLFPNYFQNYQLNYVDYTQEIMDN